MTSGRKKDPDTERIYNVLWEELETFSSIPVPSNLVWSKLVNKYKFRLSARALRIIKTEVLVTKESTLSCSTSDSSYHNSSENYSEDNRYFKILLTSDDIKSMAPNDRVNCFAIMPFTSEQDRFIVMAHFRSGTLNPDGNWSYSLQESSERHIRNISAEELYRVFKNMKRPVNLCLDTQGEQFQNLL
ncbi:hypothetical protein FQA39_LY13684 [Lamprigera yunnana]|nr:hypothetical protein FQA39_LY13684 [Lamprigera yunnana]